MNDPLPSPRPRRFSQVDVFTATVLRGNPLAVVHDGTGLDDATMQRFACWTNLSETTFLLPPTHPEADYRVRIFTPGGELPFAGHPTLGSCHAWLAAGGQPRRAGVVMQECGIGLVPIRRGERLAFAAPATTVEAVEAATLAAVRDALGLDARLLQEAAWLTNGPCWLALRLVDAEAVLALRPDHAALKTIAGLRGVGVVGPHPAGHECQFELRFFGAPTGVDEDPITGSLNASVAHWLIDRGHAPVRYVAAQGAAIGRLGRVFVERDAQATWIGGDVAACVNGSVML